MGWCCPSCHFSPHPTAAGHGGAQAQSRQQGPHSEAGRLVRRGIQTKEKKMAGRCKTGLKCSWRGLRVECLQNCGDWAGLPQPIGETLLLAEAACAQPSALTAGRESLLNCESDPLTLGVNTQHFLTSLRTEAQEVPTSARPPLSHGHGNRDMGTRVLTLTSPTAFLRWAPCPTTMAPRRLRHTLALGSFCLCSRSWIVLARLDE